MTRERRHALAKFRRAVLMAQEAEQQLGPELFEHVPELWKLRQALERFVRLHRAREAAGKELRSYLDEVGIDLRAFPGEIGAALLRVCGL